MSYNKDFLEEALAIMLFDGMTVQNAKEEGMPGAGADPRKAQDPHVMMIDVRRAWRECDWLTYDQRVALLSVSMFGTSALASEMTGVLQRTLDRRQDAGLTAMVAWMNSTYLEREAWIAEVEEENHARMMREQWDDYYRDLL